MTIFLGERDRWKQRPLHQALLEHLKARGCAGATVTRGMAGFGAHSRIRTSALAEVPVDLPIVITVVDVADKIEALAGELGAMLAGGAVVVDDVEVYFHGTTYDAGIPDVDVAAVMTRSPDAVTPETPVVAVVQLLLARDHTVVPVVDAQGKVVGVVGDRDLLKAGVTAASVSLHKAADPSTLADVLRNVATGGRIVREVMTTPAVTVRATLPMRNAAWLMHERGLKRLPVVDANDRLVGVIGRFDVLTSVAHGHGNRAPAGDHPLPREHRRVGDFMERDVPTVTETRSLDDVVAKLIDSDTKRVMVLGDDGRLAGIVTDTDLLARVDADERPGLFTLLRARWSRDADRLVRRAYGKRAADVMTAPAIAVREDAPVLEALTLSVTNHVKRLPVVDAAGRVVGVVSRPALLAASLDVAATPE